MPNQWIHSPVLSSDPAVTPAVWCARTESDFIVHPGYLCSLGRDG